MGTIRATLNIPTDDVSASDDLDIILYNGTVGNEVLFVVIDSENVNKTIDTNLGKLIITGIPVPVNDNDVTYNFSAKVRDEAGNVSPEFSNNFPIIVPGTITGPEPTYLTDNAGNRLTDNAGNNLIL